MEDLHSLPSLGSGCEVDPMVPLYGSLVRNPKNPSEDPYETTFKICAHGPHPFQAKGPYLGLIRNAWAGLDDLLRLRSLGPWQPHFL